MTQPLSAQDWLGAKLEIAKNFGVPPSEVLRVTTKTELVGLFFEERLRHERDNEEAVRIMEEAEGRASRQRSYRFLYEVKGNIARKEELGLYRVLFRRKDGVDQKRFLSASGGDKEAMGEIANKILLSYPEDVEFSGSNPHWTFSVSTNERVIIEEDLAGGRFWAWRDSHRLGIWTRI
ncbi:MAG: hypothetical protein WC531_03185 [Candidatus Paceibacterota bacterium]|jgi:hypothetical protein